MKKVKDKQVLVGADFAGFPLKEVERSILEKKDGRLLISE